MALISLLELADLSIGTPEIGVVNFNALHTLLHAIIKQLNLQDVKAEMHDEKPKPLEPVPLQEKERKGKRDESEDLPYADLEKKVIGVAAQVHGVEAQVHGVETKVVGVAAQVHGVETKVVGVAAQVHGVEAQAMALFQDLLNEVNGVKTANFHMNEGLENIKEKLDRAEPARSHSLNLQPDTQEIGDRLQTCIADQKNLDSDVRNLERRINLYPSPEEMYNMVRWEVLEDCFVTGKGKSPPTEAQSVDPSLGQPSPASVMDTQARKPSATWAGAPGSQPGSPSSRPGFPGAQPGAQPGFPGAQPGAQPGFPGAQPGAQPGSPGAQAGAPGIQPSFPGTWPSSPVTQVGPPGVWPGAPGSQAGYLGTPADTSAFQPTSPTAGHSALAAQLAIPPGPYSAVTSPASPLQEKDKRLPSSTPRESSGSSSASSRYSDTVEALRQIGQLTDLYTALKEQINHLEQFKCSHADLDKLRQFLSDAEPLQHAC
ncbi:apelin receptor A-like [Platysternon megacephalum]|uniref:Apelin receptor A-like n=1 Tax=Platysternon megacephalum TaxID=55544 RepID=A0A4D9E3E4_9SAUR|nr:apelin receptor A-like [Platysternon megacephalum]